MHGRERRPAGQLWRREGVGWTLGSLDRLDGLDSLLSIVQMPAGVPVATVGIGGGRNAGLLAVRILAAGDAELLSRVERFQAELAESVVARDLTLQERLATGR